MSGGIIPKRGQGTPGFSTLADGELGVSIDQKALYLGTAHGPVEIGNHKNWAADATEDFKNSGSSDVYIWAGMKDAKDATKYRVSSGMYWVRDNDNIEHVVTITDTYTYRLVEDKYCGSEPCIYLDWYEFDAPGELSQHLEYYGDNEVFSVNGVNKHWLPEVTDAAEGKRLRVVDYIWQPAPFTEIKSVAALPQNPDPNVLYLIREAEST